MARVNLIVMVASSYKLMGDGNSKLASAEMIISCLDK
jgi:hypothetical protein